MKAIKRKLRRNRAGFTLAETLICVLILLMVTGIVGAAIPTASNVYMKTVDAANAQVLLSTTKNVLRDKLGTSTQIKMTEGSNDVEFKNGNLGWAKLVIGAEPGKTNGENGVWLVYGKLNNGAVDYTSSTAQRAVSSEATTEHLSIRFGGDDGGITYVKSTGVVTVTKLQVVKLKADGTVDTVLAEDTFNVSTFAKEKASS